MFLSTYTRLFGMRIKTRHGFIYSIVSKLQRNSLRLPLDGEFVHESDPFDSPIQVVTLIQEKYFLLTIGWTSSEW